MTAPREPRPGGWWLRRPINNLGRSQLSGRHSRLTLRFVTSRALRGVPCQSSVYGLLLQAFVQSHAKMLANCPETGAGSLRTF